MENASHAFLDAVRKSMRQIRSAIGAAIIDPDLLTAAERLQYDGYLRREDANAAILARAKDGAPIKQIVRETGHSRGLVRRILRGQRSDVFRTRESSLEPYLPWLDAQWTAGVHNGSELWRRLKNQGFRGCSRVVSEWAGRRRRAEKADAGSLRRVPSARTIARLMTTGRDTLSKSEAVTIAAIESSAPLLVEARRVIAAFHAMIRKKSAAELDAWIKQAKASSRRVLSQRCHERQGRSTRRNHIRVVQRSDRRSDHKTQACKATNVWARETRSARSTPHRRQLNARCIKTASEPILHAE